MSEHVLVDESLVGRLPLPLAQLARRVPNAKTALERHLAAYLLWEAGLKLLASVAIVEYAERQDPDAALAERLQHLARPSLGHWWEFARRLLPVLAEGDDEGFRAVRDLLLGRTRDDLPRAAGLDAALLGALGERGTARSTVRLTELFDRMVSYRNRELGHGAAGQRAPDFYDRMARALLAGVSEVFDRLDVLAGRQLVYVDDVRRLASGDWLVDRYELIGESARRIESITVPDAQSATLPCPHRVYLEHRGGASSTRRSLHPLVCYQLETGKVFFLNGRRGKQRAEYLCYDDGDLLRLDLGADHRSLLAGVLGRPVDSELAARWATESTAEDPPEDLPRAPLTERTVGEFELLSRLGRGGMGVVYRAWQPSLCRQVAIKCMLRSGDPKAEARFAREIRALGRVEHANLVKVFTSGSEGDQWFYAMELVEGAELSGICEQLAGREASAVDESTWRDALSSAHAKARSGETPLSDERRGASSALADEPPPADSPGAASLNLPAPGGRGYVRRVVEIVERVADAAHALHEAGVVHRDIKPGNVMITADGHTPVLMDLGLAQVADETEGRITRTRQFIGTLRYASPEQILAAGQVDRRSDVYSLGATLWELLTLRPLFGATDETPSPNLMLDIQSKTPESLRKYNPQVPRDLEACVLKCLEKDRGRRYATAADLAADLNRFLRGEPVAAQPPSLGYLATKFVKRHKLPLASAAAVVFMLAAGGAIAFYRINEERKDALRARNSEANARIEAQNRARESSALAVKNKDLAEQESKARQSAVHQLRLSRLTAYDMQLDRAGKLLTTDPAAAARLLIDNEQCPPDLRDFAWGRLLSLARCSTWVIRADDSPVNRVACAPHGFLFASAGADGTVRLWSPAESLHKATKTFSGHEGAVWSVAISPDARTAASAGRDGTVRLWDLIKGHAGAVLRGHVGDVADVVFSPDGKSLASGGRDGTVRVWDVNRGVPVVTLRNDGAPILGIAFSPAGGSLAASGADRVVRIWDAVRRITGAPPQRGEPEAASGIDGGSGGDRPGRPAAQVVRDWKLDDTRERLTIAVEGAPVGPLAFAPDGFFLAGGGVDHVVRVWESRTGREAAKLSGHDGPVTALAFAPDAVTLASSGASGIKLWNTEGWREIAVLRSSSGENPTALAFSGDGGTLLAGHRSGGFSLWDIPERREWPGFRGHKKEFRRAVFSPNGALLAAGQSDGGIRLWDCTTGAPIRSLNGHTLAVSGLAFSPDGKALASASYDGTVRLWDVDSGRERASLVIIPSTANGESSALAVAFAPNGKTLSVAGQDAKIHVFDVETGRERVAFPKNPGEQATTKPPASEAAQPPTPLPALPGTSPASVKPTADSEETLRPEQLSSDQLLEHFRKRRDESRDSRDDAIGILRRLQNVIRSAARVDERYRNTLATIIGSEILNTQRLLVSRCLGYAPDGGALASADGRGFIRVWASTGELLAQVGRQPHAADRLEYSPDGRLIAVGGDDGAIVLWNPLGTGEQFRLPGRSGVQPCFSFAPDGQAFAYQAADSVRVIDVQTRNILSVFTDLNWVRDLAFAPDGTTLVGTSAARILAWNLKASTGESTLAGHVDDVRAVAASPNGWIASGDIRGRILLWSDSGGLGAELTSGPDLSGSDSARDGVAGLTFSPSGSLIASKTEKGVITVWDVVTGRACARLGTLSDERLARNDSGAYLRKPAQSTLVFSADSRLFAATSGAGRVSVWDTATWREVSLVGPQSRPLALSFGAGATTLVGAYETGEINRWDIPSRERAKLPSGRPAGVAVISPDGKTLAAGRDSYDDTADAVTGVPGASKELAPLFRCATWQLAACSPRSSVPVGVKTHKLLLSHPTAGGSSPPCRVARWRSGMPRTGKRC